MNRSILCWLSFLVFAGSSIQAQVPSEPPQPRPSFFPALLTSFDVAGITSFEFGQTFCPKDRALLPGIIPGSRPMVNFDGSAISGPLKAYLQLKFYYNEWNRLQVPLARFEMNHEIMVINLGDFYEHLDPLSLYHQELRGGGVATSFDLFDDLIKINLRFRYGNSRTGSQQGDPVFGLYNVRDSLGVYPTYLGLAHFLLTSERYRSSAGLLFLNMEDFTKDATSADIFNLYPRRNRLYGLDLGYNFPDELADCAGKVYLSSFRRNTNNTNIKRDQFDKAIVLETRGRYQDYGYHGHYNLIGTNYFTGGNPYLPVDKHGFNLGGSYVKKDRFYTTADLEFYQNNLDNDTRRPTVNTVAVQSKFNLRMKNLPNSYIGVRVKKAWSDSVVVDLVDPTMAVEEEQTRKKNAASLTFSLGGDYTWRGGWYLLWTDYCLYRDQSHYEHKLPAPANTDQWLLGLRHRQSFFRNFTLSSGANCQLTSQPADGISEQSVYLTSNGDYALAQRPLHLEGQLGLFKQWSELAPHDYSLLSFSLEPRYLYQKNLSFQGGYEIKIYLGKEKDFMAHTIKAGTQWVF